jgi:tRNA threonylcarbamoyladenosine biosynthesis protein TsaE
MDLVTGPSTGGSTGGSTGQVVGPTVVARSADAGQTRSLARALAPLCVPGDVLLLVGDLGAGKTVFAQGFAAGLGVGEQVTSPTFTLVRQYPVPPVAPPPGGPGGTPIRTLLHADVYRLDHLHEIVDLGLGELVEDGAVALVEWGDAADPLLGEESLRVELAAGDDDDERVVTVHPRGEGWSRRWEAVLEALGPWRVLP